MPNGGSLPSCAICKWHTDWHAENDRGFCQYHKVMVISHHTICSKLSYRFSFILKLFLRLKPNLIYGWIEVGYRDPAHPTLPMHHIEKVSLAPVSAYAQWTTEQIEEAHRSANAREREKFTQKYGSEQDKT